MKKAKCLIVSYQYDQDNMPVGNPLSRRDIKKKEIILLHKIFNIKSFQKDELSFN